MAIGIPTFFDRPHTTAFLPNVSIPERNTSEHNEWYVLDQYNLLVDSSTTHHKYNGWHGQTVAILLFLLEGFAGYVWLIWS